MYTHLPKNQKSHRSSKNVSSLLPFGDGIPGLRRRRRETTGANIVFLPRRVVAVPAFTLARGARRDVRAGNAVSAETRFVFASTELARSREWPLVRVRTLRLSG